MPSSGPNEQDLGGLNQLRVLPLVLVVLVYGIETMDHNSGPLLIDHELCTHPSVYRSITARATQSSPMSYSLQSYRLGKLSKEWVCQKPGQTLGLNADDKLDPTIGELGEH